MAITNNSLSKRQVLQGRYDRAKIEAQNATKNTPRFAEAAKQLKGIRSALEGLPADSKPSPNTQLQPNVTKTTQGQMNQLDGSNNQLDVAFTTPPIKSSITQTGQINNQTNNNQLSEVQLAQQNYAKTLGSTDKQMQLKQQLLNEMIGSAQGSTTEKRLQLEQQLGLSEAMKARDLYSGEVNKIGDELQGIKDNMEERGGTITKSFAQLMEARESTPLREQLIQLSKSQALEEQKIQSIESEISQRMNEQRQDSAMRIQMLEKSIDLLAVPDDQKAMAKMQLEDARAREARRLDMQEYTVKQQISKQIDLEYEKAKRVLDLELAGAETAVKVQQTAQLEATKALMKYGDINSTDPLIQRQAVIKTVEDIMNSELYKDVPLKRGVVGVATAIQQRLIEGDDLTTAIENELINNLETKDEVIQRRKDIALKEELNQALLDSREASTARTQGLTRGKTTGTTKGTTSTTTEGGLKEGEYGPPVPAGFGEETKTTTTKPKSSLQLLLEKYK